MKIKLLKKFKKSYKKLSEKTHNKFKNKIKIFQNNPLEESLNNHKLSWNWKWFSSINITWDIRAIFREIWEWKYEFVEFENIWSHSELYK